jgi:PAS domain S-box-containing protein
MNVHESEARFRSLFDNSFDAILLTKPDGSILAANPAARRMFVMTEEELIRAGRAGIVVWDERWESAIVERELTGRSIAELTLKRKDGTAFEGEVSSAVFTDADGAVKTSMIIRDVTERKKVEESLKQSEARYRDLFDNAREGVSLRRLIYDERGEIVDAELIDANPTALRAYGAGSIDEVRGKKFSEMASPEMYALALAVVKRMKSTGKAVTEEEHVGAGKNYYLVTAAPMGEDHVITTSIDITERRRMEDALKRSNADLQQFAYVASHDLKEPLRTVMNYLSLVEKRSKDRLDDRSKEFILFAMDGAKRMQAMIDDLLTYSRVEMSTKPLSPVDMGEVLAVVLKDLRVSIQESGASVTSDSLPTIAADRAQMVLLIGNIVGNAIKYRSEAAPQVHVSARGDAGEWEFSIEDNGIGIDPRYQDRLFTMFQRLHTRDDYPGTGIGLAIAKKIVERHGGRIWFESQLGKGTIFYFTIPDRSTP